LWYNYVQIKEVPMMRRLAVLALVLLTLSTLIGCAGSTSPPTPTPESCKADFTAEPRVGVGTTTVQFTDKSTGNITSWAWDFGDGGKSTVQNPAHTYTRNGNYTITLTITTPDCEDEISKPGYINITGCHT
jgi:PKD repeat protein